MTARLINIQNPTAIILKSLYNNSVKKHQQTTLP